jgi:hypothetical protein
MIKTDNSTESVDKMMNLFKLFGARKAQRRKAKRSAEGEVKGERDGITLEDAPPQ